MRLIDLSSSSPQIDQPLGLEAAQAYCKELERGNILFLPKIPFPFPEDDLEFLLGRRQANTSYHKNIAYRVHEDRVTGLARSSAAQSERLRRILKDYSSHVIAWMQRLAPFYTRHWATDYASFRPVEEEGRILSQRARNDLLHVDAFPTRPTNGDRILRFFTNIHRTRPRVWVTGECFDVLAPVFAFAAGLPQRDSALDPRAALARAGLQERWLETLERNFKRLLGRRARQRSPYDRFMLRFHNYLKANEAYQKECKKFRFDFPPGSCWIVFTDIVPHAVLSGQYALEMTFIVSHDSVLLPELSPIQILERLSGLPLGIR